MSNILVIDDEVSILETLSAILQDEGHSVESTTVYDKETVFSSFDLLILDVWLESQNGIDILNSVHKEHPGLPVLMISGHGNIEMAVDAVKKGAYDFIEKPLRLERVLTSIENALKMRDLSRKVTSARNLALEKERIVGQNREITTILDALPKVSEARKPILLTGEKGSGKALLAHHIFYHANLSGNFMEISLRLMAPEDVADSLFGYYRDNKYTEGKLQKDNSVLLLQEIALMKPDVATRLLEALTTGYFQPNGSDKKIALPENLILISSSRLSITELNAEKNLSEELVYALSGFHFHLPPLRDRKEDIQDIFAYLIERYSSDSNTSPIECSKEAFIYLQNYTWPGNVRELESLIEKLVILSPNPVIELETVKYFMESASSTWQSPDSFTNLKEALKHFERSYILYAVQKNEGNITRAARELDIERTHLYRKLKKLGLQNIRTEVLEEIEQNLENN